MTKRGEVPSWVREYRQRTRLLDIIAGICEDNCECIHCLRMKELAQELESLFIPGSPGPPTISSELKHGRTRRA